MHREDAVLPAIKSGRQNFEDQLAQAGLAEAAVSQQVPASAAKPRQPFLRRGSRNKRVKQPPLSSGSNNSAPSADFNVERASLDTKENYETEKFRTVNTSSTASVNEFLSGVRRGAFQGASQGSAAELAALSQQTEETFAALQETLKRRTAPTAEGDAANDPLLMLDQSFLGDVDEEPPVAPAVPVALRWERSTIPVASRRNTEGLSSFAGRGSNATDVPRKGIAAASNAALAELERLTLHAQERMAALERRAAALDIREERVRTLEQQQERRARELHELEMKLAGEVASWKSYVALKRKESGAEKLLKEKQKEMQEKEQKLQRLLTQKNKRMAALEKKLEEQQVRLAELHQEEEDSLKKKTERSSPPTPPRQQRLSAAFDAAAVVSPSSPQFGEKSPPSFAAAPAENSDSSLFRALVTWNHHAEWEPFAAALRRATQPVGQPVSQCPRSDGAVESTFVNGRREVAFAASGLRRVVLPCGWILTFFRNGDVKGADPFQRRQYYQFGRANIESISTSDGLRFDFFLADGQLECRLPSGTVLVKFRDGTLRSVSSL